MANQEIIAVSSQYDANREIIKRAEEGYKVVQISACGGSYERLWILFEKVDSPKYQTIE